MAAAEQALNMRGLTPWLAERELYGASFRDFVPAAFRVIEPATDFVPGFHIDAIADHLQWVSEGEIQYLIISVAPRSLKSIETCVMWPAWDWIKHPTRRFLFGAYGMDLAEDHSLACRRLIESEWYQERWGCFCGARPHAEWCTGFRLMGDQNVKTKYDNDRGGRRVCAGVMSGTTGKGGDILGMDDPVDILGVQSEAIQKRARTFTKKVWFGRRNSPKKSAMVFIAQRSHAKDVTGMLLEEMQFPWVHLCIPTEYNPKRHCFVKTKSGKTWEDPRKERGQLMWPAQFGASENAAAKLDPWTYSAQHDQDPKPAGGALFKVEWIRFWQPPGVNLPPHDPVTGASYVEHPDDGIRMLVEHAPRLTDFDNVIMSLDSNVKDEAQIIRKGELPDPQSLGVLGRKGGRVFLLDRWNARLGGIEGAIAALRTMSARWPQAVDKLIEDKANGPAIMAQLRREVGGFILVTPTGSKVQRVMRRGATDKDRDARAMSMIGMVHSGMLLLPHPLLASKDGNPKHSWVWEVVTELTTFPNGATDDDVDMLSQALTHMQPWVWREADEAMDQALAGGKPPSSVKEMFDNRIKAVMDAALKTPKAGPADPYQRRR